MAKLVSSCGREYSAIAAPTPPAATTLLLRPKLEPIAGGEAVYTHRENQSQEEQAPPPRRTSPDRRTQRCWLVSVGEVIVIVTTAVSVVSLERERTRSAKHTATKRRRVQGVSCMLVSNSMRVEGF
eukprot:6759701-Pyramimonas_sp.AAC.1